MIRRLRLGGRGLGWYALDQGLSSFSNIAVVLFVARLSDPTGLGLFTLAFGVYTLALGASTALASEPLLIRHSASAEGRHMAIRQAAGTALAIGLTVGVLTAATGLLIGGRGGAILAAMGAVLPFTLLQDCWRKGFFASGRPQAAAVNDATWVGVVLVAFSTVAASGSDVGVPALTLLWGSGAAVAAVLGAAQHRCGPRISATWSWLRTHRDLGPALLVDVALLTGVMQLVLVIVAAVASLAEAGAFRVAQTLFGPLAVALLATRSYALPATARLVSLEPHRLPAAVRRYAVLATTLCGLYALPLLLVPDSVGEQVLGSSWYATAEVLPFYGLLVLARAPTAAAVVGLRALGDTRRTLLARVVTSVALIAGSAAGAHLAGGAGAAAGLALAQILGACVWHACFLRSVRSGFRSGRPPTGMHVEG